MKIELNDSESSSISINGIIDVNGGKGVIVEKVVDKGTVLRGQILMGNRQFVQTAMPNIKLEFFAGIAMNKATEGNVVFTMVKGVGRMVIHKNSHTIYPCDNICSTGGGRVAKLWSEGLFQLLMMAKSVGDGYVDCQFDCK